MAGKGGADTPTIEEVDAIIKDIAANPRKQNRRNLDLTFVIIKLLHDNEQSQRTIKEQGDTIKELGEEINDLQTRLEQAEERAAAMATNLDKVKEDTQIIRQDVERRQKEYHLQLFNKEKEETANKIVIRKLPYEEGETAAILKEKVSNILVAMKLNNRDCDFEHVRRIPKSRRPQETAEGGAAMEVDPRPPLPPLVVVTLQNSGMKGPFFLHLKNLRNTDFNNISCQNEIPRCVRKATAEKEKLARQYRETHHGHRTRVFYESGQPIIKFRTSNTENWTKLDL